MTTANVGGISYPTVRAHIRAATHERARLRDTVVLDVTFPDRLPIRLAFRGFRAVKRVIRAAGATGFGWDGVQDSSVRALLGDHSRVVGICSWDGRHGMLSVESWRDMASLK